VYGSLVQLAFGVVTFGFARVDAATAAPVCAAAVCTAGVCAAAVWAVELACATACWAVELPWPAARWVSEAAAEAACPAWVVIGWVLVVAGAETPDDGCAWLTVLDAWLAAETGVLSCWVDAAAAPVVCATAWWAVELAWVAACPA
jgi:hypothetical protein